MAQRVTSYIATRLGRWHDAVTSNIDAYEGDAAFAEHCMSPYGPEHNTAMLVYAAVMAGEVLLLVNTKQHNAEQILSAY